jgi:serine/threonine protein kinase
LDSRLVLPINTVLDGSYRIIRVVGSGGFGITYEAEDTNLGTLVAIKEYYPFDFGDRDRTMSVRPKSDRHKHTFEWGRSNFLQEARTLAHFEHPSIVRVTRVFEANSTAYMVMRFERGESLEGWLEHLGRQPTQQELDAIVAPLLDALQLMHGANFLHRDIAPDNIIIRPDGTPVLLDFGAARRAVAEMSRSLTGIVKAGYSPHEQYSSDGRLQGPWSDLYALGGTLYRAVTGKPPEEATLRFDEDHMTSAVQGARGQYRRQFLQAIDSCLKVRHSERPRSVSQLRPMLLGLKSEPKETHRLAEPTIKLPSTPPPASDSRRLWSAIVAILAVVAVLGGIYGGYQYQRLQVAGRSVRAENVTASMGTPRVTADALQRQAALDAERRQKESEAANARRLDEERRQQEALQAQQQQAEKQRREEARIAALEEDRRNAEAAEKRRQAALEEARRNEETLREAERVRLANIPDDAKRAELVRKVQQVLRHSRCDDGALTGRSSDAQDGLDKFVQNARRRGRSKPQRIELAKASVGDFETWLNDARAIEDGLCVPPKREKPTAEKSGPVASTRRAPAQPEISRPRRLPSYTPSYAPSYRSGGGSPGPTLGVGN